MLKRHPRQPFVSFLVKQAHSSKKGVTFQREPVSFLLHFSKGVCLFFGEAHSRLAASEKVSLFIGSLSLFWCTFQRESVSFLVKHFFIGPSYDKIVFWCILRMIMNQVYFDVKEGS